MRSKWLATLAEQAFNSMVVAGIAAASMMLTQEPVALKTVAASFVLTFLIELRKFRKF